jgi:ribonuclease Z
LGREKELQIYGPERLDEIINPNFSVPGIELSYKLTYHTISKGGHTIFQNKRLEVETIEMNHRVETFGFLFKEKKSKRNIKKDAIEKYQIPVSQMGLIKDGADLIAFDGNLVPNHLITLNPPKPLSVAMLSDSAYTTNFIEQVKDVDLMYHEATFADDRASIAIEKFHSTARQAATIAKLANAKQLLIGHFSARYKDLEPLITQAREVFPNTLVAVEGIVVEVK